MTRDAKFWIAMAVFQVFFGLAVFELTRAHYAPQPNATSAQAPVTSQPAPAPGPALGPGGITQLALERLSHSSSSEPASQDPVELSRQASEAFSSQQYDRAADLYGRLSALSPNNVDILNEWGLTLHYSGRSTEALQKLNQGAALDPTHQRIRLTLGYVNSQVGNFKEARAALTAATQLGSDQSVRQSALDMLKKLPQ
jgi:tetratricopeptide (TPR) repeat protein